MAKKFIGTVTSTKMEKTVVVLVERKFRHPRYLKVIVRHKKYKAHNDIKGIKINDAVEIEETKPLSKEKRFVVRKKL
ncbi:MAG: 30S ribosomal protein S17 [Patescibacteria group bacterium]